MRKNTSLLASAVTTVMASILAMGSASATQLTDTAEVIFEVEATCAFDVAQDMFRGQSDMASGSGAVEIGSGMGFGGSLQIVCSSGVPYTIETDANASGSFSLVGDNTSNAIPGWIRHTAYGAPVAFGTLANNEHIAGVANGDAQTYQFSIDVNKTESGAYLPIPVADIYRHTLTFTATY
jgi:spore coat protein U-like protein